MDKRYFSKKIVEWYLRNKRNLPWRDTTDPYKIWLSEIILQQTRVSQGLPYYEKFIQTYPTVRNLATAPQDKVMRLWQGLGYYTRARNLHKCSKDIVALLDGTFPDNFAALKKLPGIGDYTAAAIASFAFGEAVAVVDGNVFRVLSRIFGIDAPIDSPQGRNVFTRLANELISQDRPGSHNQAVMEFGATFCVPLNPPCHECIFKSSCFAFQKGIQSYLPVKAKTKESRKRYFHYLVFRKGKSLMMRKRIEKDIWTGLYDFPLIEHSKPVTISKVLADPVLHSIDNRNELLVSETYKHVLTHQTIFCRFIVIPWSSRSEAVGNHRFYSIDKVSSLPKPVLISRFLDDYIFHS